MDLAKLQAISLRVAALHNMTLELGRSEHGGLRVDLTGDEFEPRRA